MKFQNLIVLFNIICVAFLLSACSSPTPVISNVTMPVQQEQTFAVSSTPSSNEARAVEVEYRDGRTYVTEIVRNEQRATITDMTVRKIFPKSVLESASLLSSVTLFTIIEEDPIIDFHLGKMEYLESKPLVYSIPGNINASQINQLVTELNVQKELTGEEIAQKEAEDEARTAMALVTTVDMTASTINGITASELALHNSKTDCWVVYKNTTYDVTKYLPKHPGGTLAISKHCGTLNFEKAFKGQHGTSKEKTLASNSINMGEYVG